MDDEHDPELYNPDDSIDSNYGAMNLSDLYVLKVQQFCLVFFRVAGIFIIAPVFSQEQIPMRIKAALAFFISLALFPVTRIAFTSLRENWGLFAVDIGRELIVGIILGYCASILFGAVQFASQLLDRQMGFGLARMLDPLSGEEGSPILQFQGLIATLLFLVVNGHHWLIIALNRSFDFAPAGNVALSAAIPNKLIEMVGSVFSMGIRIAAPVFVLLIIVTILMGVVARAVSGMNILIVGLPLRLGLGLIGLLLTVPVFGLLFRKFFIVIQKDVMYLLHRL